tara:strand:- start:4600 stop:4755 length:156 start_codon:yes stop_codon:yes gene_type:complete
LEEDFFKLNELGFFLIVIKLSLKFEVVSSIPSPQKIHIEISKKKYTSGQSN